MSASINDVLITIISNGKTAYYCSYKGIGNVLWEKNFGLYSNVKPNAFTIFDFTKSTIWKKSINSLDEPLTNPVYGMITIDFDTKTIIDNNGFCYWQYMNLGWFVNSIFKFANREMIGWDEQSILTKKTIIEHLKDGNFYIANRFHRPIDLMLPTTIDEAYNLFFHLGFDDDNHNPVHLIEKDYRWVQIKLPIGWTISNAN